MASVTVDIVEGSLLTETKDGIATTRIATVTGVTGSSTERLYRALTAPGVPAYGDAHPAIPEIQVVEKSISPAAKGATGSFRISIIYRTPTGDELVDGAEDQIEIGATVVSRTTSVDVNGKQMVVRHSVEELDESGNVIDVRTEEQVLTASVEEALPTYVVTRRETQSPLLKARTFVSRVGEFLGRPSIFSPWMCRGITGRSTDGGATFLVTYTFHFRREGWLFEDYPIDPETGTPFVGGKPNRFQVLGTASFAGLGLPAPGFLGVDL